MVIRVGPQSAFRLASKIKPDERGVAAIEFALVAPVFLVLIFGMMVFGLYFGVAHSVQQLASDTARASIAGITDSERITLAQQHLESHASDYPLINPEKIKVKAEISPSDIDQFIVALAYDASDLPIWMLGGFVPLPDKTIVRSASIKNGGY